MDGPPVKSDETDWLRIQNEYSTHVHKIGHGKRSRVFGLFLLTKRIAASRNENGVYVRQKHAPLNFLFYLTLIMAINIEITSSKNAHTYTLF